MSEKIQGEDGNIFNLLGIVGRELKRNNQDDKVEEMCNRVYNSESYNEALSIIQDLNTILDFYEANKVKLGMFKKEVLETLDMTNYAFNKIRNNFKIAGSIRMTMDFKTLTVDMYDREYVYNYKFNKEV